MPPSKGRIIHRGTGNLEVRGSSNLSPFDPIKNTPGTYNSQSINGTRRDSVVGRGLGRVEVRASDAPSPRIPTVNPLNAAARTPSLPRRQYIPVVGEVPAPEEPWEPSE